MSTILWQIYIRWYDNNVLLLDKNAYLDFYSVSSMKQQSEDRYVAPCGHIILIPSQQVFVFTP